MMALDETELDWMDEMRRDGMGTWTDMYCVMYFIGRKMPVMMGKCDSCLYDILDASQLLNNEGEVDNSCQVVTDWCLRGIGNQTREFKILMIRRI